MKVVTLAATLPLLLVVGCASPIQAKLDAEVRRLCAIDGGVKVYETVSLPSDKFNKWGQINFFHPTQGEDALGSEYIYKSDKRYYKRGEIEQPAMWRDHIQIFRRVDGKLLGESIRYSRRGGDAPGPWHPSSFSCPPVTTSWLLSEVFRKEER